MRDGVVKAAHRAAGQLLLSWSACLAQPGDGDEEGQASGSGSVSSGDGGGSSSGSVSSGGGGTGLSPPFVTQTSRRWLPQERLSEAAWALSVLVRYDNLLRASPSVRVRGGLLVCTTVSNSTHSSTHTCL